MLLPLTENQQTLFKEICLYIKAKNYPPTISELQDILSINNPGSVHKAFIALHRKGYIHRKKGMHRGFKLTNEAERKYLQ